MHLVFRSVIEEDRHSFPLGLRIEIDELNRNIVFFFQGVILEIFKSLSRNIFVTPLGNENLIRRIGRGEQKINSPSHRIGMGRRQLIFRRKKIGLEHHLLGEFGNHIIANEIKSAKYILTAIFAAGKTDINSGHEILLLLVSEFISPMETQKWAN